MIKWHILALALLLSTSVAAEDKRVKFAIGEWAPYTSSSQNAREKVAEKVVIRAFETQGYQVELNYFPWPRSLRLAEQSDYDGSFPWMHSDERQEQFIFSEPFFSQKIVFFTFREANFSWNDKQDLLQYKIGGTQDYQATNILYDLGVTPEISNTEEGNFQKLVKNRIDAYPTGLMRGQYLIEKLFDQEEAQLIVVASKPIIEDDMHILFSKANPKRSQHLNKVFSKGLQQLIESGEYHQIVFSDNHINSQ